MHHSSDLRILFATSFSDACFRSARPLAQLGDRHNVNLTIAHVCRPGVATIETRRALHSFLAEADHYDSCRRMLVESDDTVKAIVSLCEKEQFDMVFAPASDRLGLHSLFTSSFRARLLQQCKTPVWTAGTCLDRTPARTHLAVIACLVDFDNPNQSHVRLAMSLASQTGAQLRLVHVIPRCDEGTLARSIDSRAPLSPDVALAMARCAFGEEKCPEVDIAIGDVSKELPGLLRQSGADLLFVGPGQALAGMWRPTLASYVDRLPCPAICIDGASSDFNRWSFERPEVQHSRRLLSHAAEEAIAS